MPQRQRAPITHALIIREEPLAKILAGTKTWEIRGSATKRRGRIGLIESKSGLVVGTCDLVDVVGPLGLAQLRGAARRTGFRLTTLDYISTYAWVLRDARRLRRPVAYEHPGVWLPFSLLRRVYSCGVACPAPSATARWSMSISKYEPAL